MIKLRYSNLLNVLKCSFIYRSCIVKKYVYFNSEAHVDTATRLSVLARVTHFVWNVTVSVFGLFCLHWSRSKRVWCSWYVDSRLIAEVTRCDSPTPDALGTSEDGIHSFHCTLRNIRINFNITCAKRVGMPITHMINTYLGKYPPRIHVPYVSWLRYLMIFFQINYFHCH